VGTVYSIENKLELFDGQALADLRERENMIIALIYNIGLKHLVKILPSESKTILKELLDKQQLSDCRKTGIFTWVRMPVFFEISKI